jgi:hypothetical protein
MTSMRARAGRLAKLIAAAAAIAVSLVSAGSAGLRTGTTTANPTLYITYAMNCTFTILDDSGKQVTSVAPGAYQVDVRTPVVFGMYPTSPGQTDFYACRGIPQFQLTGPGVSLFTTMTAGCEQDKLFTETFAPNATYVAQDLNQPSLTHAAFTTLASGTSSPVAVTYGGGKGKPQASTDIAGSLKVKATLHATVTANGALKLVSGGKTVSKLAAGRYTFAISDQDAKASFTILGPTYTAPKTLTAAGFKGTHSVVLSLTSGRWTYYSSLAGVHFFRVTAD